MNQGLNRHRQLQDALLLPPRMAVPSTAGSGHPGRRPALPFPMDGELVREGGAGRACALLSADSIIGVA